MCIFCVMGAQVDMEGLRIFDKKGKSRPTGKSGISKRRDAVPIFIFIFFSSFLQHSPCHQALLWIRSQPYLVTPQRIRLYNKSSKS